MAVLRDFVYTTDQRLLMHVLQRFGIVVPQGEYIALLRFEVITPDSFIWRLGIGKHVYYLYAEDYIPGLDHVRKVVSSYLKTLNGDSLNQKC